MSTFTFTCTPYFYVYFYLVLLRLPLLLLLLIHPLLLQLPLQLTLPPQIPPPLAPTLSFHLATLSGRQDFHDLFRGEQQEPDDFENLEVSCPLAHSMLVLPFANLN